MESFRITIFLQNQTLSEWNLSERNPSEWNLLEGIFQKIRYDPTGIFQNGIFQKESFRKYFQQNPNFSEGIIQKRLFEPILGS
jgi:hypothetical protein